MVQERYETMRASFGQETQQIDPYLMPVDADTPVFKEIHPGLAASEICFRDGRGSI